MGRHATLVVAHRLQTIVGSNRIWVIEGGRAVETGEHQELIRAQGRLLRFLRRAVRRQRGLADRLSEWTTPTRLLYQGRMHAIPN